VIDHVCPERRLGDLFSHELRWARTIRAVDPAGFAGSAVTHPVPLALLGLALTGLQPLGLLVLAGALISRLALQRSVDHLLRTKEARAWLVPVRDLLSFAVFVASFFTGAVSWRGARFRVRSDGTMTAQQSPASVSPQRESR
jgi:ceramide glucosyltransferase